MKGAAGATHAKLGEVVSDGEKEYFARLGVVDTHNLSPPVFDDSLAFNEFVEFHLGH